MSLKKQFLGITFLSLISFAVTSFAKEERPVGEPIYPDEKDQIGKILSGVLEGSTSLSYRNGDGDDDNGLSLELDLTTGIPTHGRGFNFPFSVKGTLNLNSTDGTQYSVETEEHLLKLGVARIDWNWGSGRTHNFSGFQTQILSYVIQEYSNGLETKGWDYLDVIIDDQVLFDASSGAGLVEFMVGGLVTIGRREVSIPGESEWSDGPYSHLSGMLGVRVKRDFLLKYSLSRERATLGGNLMAQGHERIFGEDLERLEAAVKASGWIDVYLAGEKKTLLGGIGDQTEESTETSLGIKTRF